jgi:hypothetical protein
MPELHVLLTLDFTNLNNSEPCLLHAIKYNSLLPIEKRPHFSYINGIDEDVIMNKVFDSSISDPFFEKKSSSYSINKEPIPCLCKILAGAVFEYYPNENVGLVSYLICGREHRRKGIVSCLHEVTITKFLFLTL